MKLLSEEEDNVESIIKVNQLHNDNYSTYYYFVFFFTTTLWTIIKQIITEAIMMSYIVKQSSVGHVLHKRLMAMWRFVRGEIPDPPEQST